MLLIWGPAISQEEIIKISITTEDTPERIHWVLSNANEEIIAKQDTGYTLQHHTYEHTYVLPERQCYSFQILYLLGNGLSNDGKYSISINDSIVVEGNNVWFERTHSFNCLEGEDCSTPERITEDIYNASLPAKRNHWYYFSPQYTGVYSLNTCSKSKDDQLDTELFIYNYCADLLSRVGPEGTLLYSDDGVCSPGSSIQQMTLHSSKVYSIRVRVKDPDPTSLITFQLKKETDIEGCTNPISCNYNIFATIDDGSCVIDNCLPDLVVSETDLKNSISLDSIMNVDTCMIKEGCLRGLGLRDIIRFTTTINNVGNADYIVGTPDVNDAGFSFNNCHRHAHKLGYAEYMLYKGSGDPLPIGFKNGFCVFDLSCDNPTEAKFSCEYMGISAGCQDIYDASIGCQWVDITDVEDGQYTLVVRINWDRVPDLRGLPEMDYENNWAQACIDIDRSSGELVVSTIDECAVYTDCLGTPFGQSVLDCEGVCGGAAHFGDLNQNAEIDSIDIQMYLRDIQDGASLSSPCLDIYKDGKMTLYDASLMWQCYAENNLQSPNEHIHCLFPAGSISSFDHVDLKLDFEEDTIIEVSYRSPTSALRGLSFALEGVIIDKVELLDDRTTDALSFNDNLVQHLVLDHDNFIPSNKNLTPLYRIHVKEFTQSNICIQEEIEVFNKQNNLLTQVNTGDCLISSAVANVENEVNGIQLYPTITTKNITLHSHMVENMNQVRIVDVKGNVVMNVKLDSKSDPSIVIDISHLDKGVYFTIIYTRNSQVIKKFIKT